MDNAMCMNEKCPLHKKCYRFTGPANDMWQDYCDFKYDFEKKDCEYYWPVKEVEVKRRRKKK
jgi:hypothetical protein